MARYGYFCADDAWLVQRPTASRPANSARITPGDFDPGRMGEVVFRVSTKQGVAVEYCCDGLVVFDFKGYPPLASEGAEHSSTHRFSEISSFILRRTEIINAHALCLKAAAAALQSRELHAVTVSPHDVVYLPDADVPAQSVAFRSQSSSYRYMARYISQYQPGLPLRSDPRISRRLLIINEATLTETVSRVEKCIDLRDEDALKLCALLNFAIGSLQDHDYSRCLVTCWVVIEALLNKRWDEYLNMVADESVGGGKKFINSDRMNKLESNDYTASIKTEVLSLLGNLTFEEYSLIDIVRKTRNDWMHDLKDVPMEKAKIALKASSMLFRSKFNVELPEATSLRL